MKIRHALAALLIVLALPARATEYTDLWWNPAESGWGLTVTHQNNVVFLAFFVFGADGKATWFSSAAFFTQRDSNLNPIYTGTLFQSTGPYFGAGFNPAAVKATEVGTATFAVTSATSANLGYTVNGVGVAKALVRQTFRINPDVNGEYVGGLVAAAAVCPNTAPSPYESATAVSISGTLAETTIALGGGNGCATKGAYVQDGRLGRVAGAFTCPDQRKGTATFTEIEANRTGIKAHYAAQFDDGCQESGHIVATRRLGSP